MATRMRRRPSTASLRRKRVWARTQEASIGIGQAGSTIDLGAAFTAEMGTLHLPVGVTIGGVLLDFVASRTDAATSGTTSQLQIGVIVTSEDTAAEVERPLAEPHADWMWQQMIGFQSGAAGTIVSTFAVGAGPIRIKSRRRMEELGQNLFLVAQGYDIAPTFALQVFASTLLILP